MEFFIPLTKVDEEQRLVWGRATQELPDKAKEIMDYETSKPMFQEWSDGIAKATGGKSLGNLRVMHQKIAAGRFEQIDFNDAEKAIDVCAKVVDDVEWNKVKAGVYTGFSIGGGYAKRWQDGGYTRYTAAPTEISLVDNPCLTSATFMLVKADGLVEEIPFIQPIGGGALLFKDALKRMPLMFKDVPESPVLFGDIVPVSGDLKLDFDRATNPVLFKDVAQDGMMLFGDLAKWSPNEHPRDADGRWTFKDTAVVVGATAAGAAVGYAGSKLVSHLQTKGRIDAAVSAHAEAVSHHAAAVSAHQKAKAKLDAATTRAATTPSARASAAKVEAEASVKSAAAHVRRTKKAVDTAAGALETAKATPGKTSAIDDVLGPVASKLSSVLAGLPWRAKAAVAASVAAGAIGAFADVKIRKEYLQDGVRIHVEHEGQDDSGQPKTHRIASFDVHEANFSQNPVTHAAYRGLRTFETGTPNVGAGQRQAGSNPVTGFTALRQVAPSYGAQAPAQHNNNQAQQQRAADDRARAAAHSTSTVGNGVGSGGQQTHLTPADQSAYDRVRKNHGTWTNAIRTAASEDKEDEGWLGNPATKEEFLTGLHEELKTGDISQRQHDLLTASIRNWDPRSANSPRFVEFPHQRSEFAGGRSPMAATQPVVAQTPGMSVDLPTHAEGLQDYIDHQHSRNGLASRQAADRVVSHIQATNITREDKGRLIRMVDNASVKSSTTADESIRNHMSRITANHSLGAYANPVTAHADKARVSHDPHLDESQKKGLKDFIDDSLKAPHGGRFEAYYAEKTKAPAIGPTDEAAMMARMREEQRRYQDTGITKVAAALLVKINHAHELSKYQGQPRDRGEFATGKEGGAATSPAAANGVSATQSPSNNAISTKEMGASIGGYAGGGAGYRSAKAALHAAPAAIGAAAAKVGASGLLDGAERVGASIAENIPGIGAVGRVAASILPIAASYPAGNTGAALGATAGRAAGQTFGLRQRTPPQNIGQLAGRALGGVAGSLVGDAVTLTGPWSIPAGIALATAGGTIGENVGARVGDFIYQHFAAKNAQSQVYL